MLVPGQESFAFSRVRLHEDYSAFPVIALINAEDVGGHWAVRKAPSEDKEKWFLFAEQVIYGVTVMKCIISRARRYKDRFRFDKEWNEHDIGLLLDWMHYAGNEPVGGKVWTTPLMLGAVAVGGEYHKAALQDELDARKIAFIAAYRSDIPNHARIFGEQQSAVVNSFPNPEGFLTGEDDFKMVQRETDIDVPAAFRPYVKGR